MIQVTATMRVLVAIEPVDLRKGIDGLAQLCREKLAADPFSGCLFIFRSRRGTTIKTLAFDGQGYWMAQRRLSTGRFKWWPEASGPAKSLEAYEAQLLMLLSFSKSLRPGLGERGPTSCRRVSDPAIRPGWYRSAKLIPETPKTAPEPPTSPVLLPLASHGTPYHS